MRVKVLVPVCVIVIEVLGVAPELNVVVVVCEGVVVSVTGAVCELVYDEEGVLDLVIVFEGVFVIVLVAVVVIVFDRVLEGVIVLEDVSVLRAVIDCVIVFEAVIVGEDVTVEDRVDVTV